MVVEDDYESIGKCNGGCDLCRMRVDRSEC